MLWGMTSRPVFRATLAMEAAAALVVWAVVGPMVASQRPVAELDYLVHVPEPPRLVSVLVAGAAGVAAVVAAVRARRRASDPGAAAWALGLGAATGAAVGYGGRVLTAKVIGANIGGGMVLLFGPPAFLMLTVTVLALARNADSMPGAGGG